MREWLEQFFVQPLGLLGLLAIPIIIIIYLIKARYVQRPVSSTFIWKRSLKYVKRKIPMSLIVSLLLIIQILTIITASLAIARMKVKPIKSEEVILIVDASASMKSKDASGKTRFDLAIDEISGFAEGANSSNQVSVILVSNEAVVKCERLESKLDIEEKLTELQCTDYTITEKGLDQAFTLAQRIRDNHNPYAKIKFITDKEYSQVENLEVINIARETDKNLSILIAEQTPLPNKNYEFRATLTSFGYDGFGSECTIQLNVDDTKKYVKTIQVPDAGADLSESVEVIFTPSNRTSTDESKKIYVKIDSITEFTKATISIEARGDSLVDDNSYSVFSVEERKPNIFMVSSGFKTDSTGKVDTSRPTTLQAALIANGYVLRSENMYISIPEDMELSGFDLYIFEGVDIPDNNKLPTDGAIWIINPTSLPSGDKGIGLRLGEKHQYADEDNQGYLMYKTSGTNTESLAYTTITNGIEATAFIGEYVEILYDGANVEQIFSCNQKENHPALLAGTYTTSKGSVRMLVTSFNFRKSSWATMVVDYPLLVNNLITYSIPKAVSQTEQYEIGSTVPFNAPAGTKTISVYHDGTLISAQENVMTVNLNLNRVGLYEVVVGFADSTVAEKHYYLPTGISADECRINAIGDMISAPEIKETENIDRVEIFWWLIALLLLLLVVEWGVYHRDGF